MKTRFELISTRAGCIRLRFKLEEILIRVDWLAGEHAEDAAPVAMLKAFLTYHLTAKQLCQC